MVTQSVDVTSRLTAQTDAPVGEGVVALIAPIDAGAVISANVPKRYYRAADAETDHGVGSLIAVGVAAARANGAPPVLAIGVAARASSPFTETIGDSSVVTTGTLNVTRLPLRKADITAVSRDGTNILVGVVFVSVVPTGLTPAAGEIYINPKTGLFKLGTATSGVGAGLIITYAAYDWSAAYTKLSEYGDFEVIAPAGMPLTADNFGVYDALSTLAAADEKVVAGALGSAVLVEDINGPNFDVTGLRGDHIFLVAANGYTGDLVSAIAARVAREPANATFNDQTAPTQGVTYTAGYARSVLGDEVDPSADTLHYMGVNGIYRDPSGTFRISSARAAVGYSDNAKFIFRRRVINAVSKGLKARLRGYRQGTSTQIPFDEAGISGVRSQIGSKLAEYVDRGLISSGPTIDIPPLEEISASDKANAVLSGISVGIRLPGQIHVFEISLDASLA